MRGPIQSLDVSYFLHATEDPEKVDGAVKAFFGGIMEPESEVLEGHYGNRIIRVVHHLTGDEAASAFAELASRLPKGVRRDLTDRIEAHLDEHFALYLRLDKQKLIVGEAEVADADPVRVRVKPRLFTVRGGAASYFRRLIG